MKKLALKINKILTKIVYRISPKLYFNLVYFKHRGKFPNLKNPQDLSEIIISQMLSGEICKYAIFTDKYRVRKFIEEWGFSEYLPKLYGVWNSENEIDFSKLPNSFVLKTNHGCGKHYICTDKKDLDIQIAKKTIGNALSTRYGEIEKHYNMIEPLCFAEEYIDDGSGKLPTDYKFMSCNGIIKCVLICKSRETNLKLIAYDTNWVKLDWIRAYERYDGNIDKPKNFDKMLAIATEIAKRFPQVRVDLYSLPNGKIYIGELTFTPEGGLVRYFTNQALSVLGNNSPKDK